MPLRCSIVRSVAFIVLAAVVPACAADGQGPKDAESPAAPITRIAIGSCVKQDRPQPIWDAVLAAEPDLFVFLGDNIYADTRDMAVLRAKYDQLAAVPGFAKLRASCPLLATWDDHDYGENDAGAEYPKKRESRDAFLDFWQVPRDAPRRSHDGVYDAVTFGPAGKRVQFILLDTRTFRSPLKQKANRVPRTGPYEPSDDPQATVLGADQWTWLEARLREPADLRIVCSSIQVIAQEHGWEKWGNFPRERQRLFDLITKTGAGGVLFVSGDRHAAELSRLRPGDAGVPYPLYDLTASSLNQMLGPDALIEPNRDRLGDVYRGTNFGLITVNWGRKGPAVVMQIRGEAGKPVLEQTVLLSDLKAK